MPLMPVILDDHRLQFRRPNRLFHQHFGHGRFDQDLFHPHNSVGPIRVGYFHPWRYHPSQRSGMCKINEDKDNFEVNVDVQQFAPEEIIVKTVDDFVVVEGKHEEREDDHGYNSRQFQRRYKLPPKCMPDAVKSSLSSDGVLTITAPKKPLALPGPNERVVPIIHTNKPALKEQVHKEKNINK